MDRVNGFSVERKHLFYALWIFILTTSAFLLLYRFFHAGLPGWLIVATGLAFLSMTAYRAHTLIGWHRSLTLLGTTTTVTFLGELIGIHTGAIFGQYHYTNALGVKLWGVPIGIIPIWNILITASYLIVISILKRSTAHWNHNHSRWAHVLIAAILTGIAVMAVDCIIDPIAITAGLWKWHNGGLYFPDISGGVPLYNFFCWFFLSALSVFFTELCSKPSLREKVNTNRHHGVVLYLSTCLSMCTLAFLFDLVGPAVIGAVAMGTFVIAYVVTNWRR